MAQNGNNDLPEWITTTLFEDFFKKEYPEFKKINKMKAAPALKPGENYSTLMMRVKFELELKNSTTKTLYYMLKLPHKSEMFKKMTDNFDIFEVESMMYLDFVPEFENLYQAVGSNVKFAPRAYKLNVKKQHLLLEDLSQRNFKNTNRLDGLDLVHTQSVLKKLAQWHAASAKFVEIKGGICKLLQTGFYTESNRQFMKETAVAGAKSFLKCASSFKDNEIYLAKLPKLLEKAIDLTFEAAVVDESEFNVLNHGDCWSNNVMFQYDAFGKIKETFLIDYQLPKYGSPAQDLYYFLFSSTKLEIKLANFDQFVRYYHSELIKHLKLLKFEKKLPTLKDIHIMLLKHGIWGFTTANGTMAGVLLDPTDNANFENCVSETDEAKDFMQKMYTSRRYRSHIDVVLPWLSNRGAMDC